jgi:integrase
MAKRNEGEVLVFPVLWTYSTNKQGLHPVKLRVTFQRKQVYYSVLNGSKEKLFLSPEDFKHITETPKLRDENKRNKDAITDAEQKAKKAIAAATNDGRDPFSFGEFERKFLGEESGVHFLRFFKTHLSKLEQKGQAGTVRVYSGVLHSFGKFINNGTPIIQQNGNKEWVYVSHKDIDPANITPDLLERYEGKLRQDGYTITWISICMRTLRAIYNRLAVKDSYLKMKYPFSTKDYDDLYKIPAGSGQKGQTLTTSELADFIKGKVAGEEIPENGMYRSKMLFLASFYGQGLNFKDLALLRNSNKKGDNIEFLRQKTIRTRRKAVVVSIPITKELENILLEIGNPDKRKNSFIFEIFDPAVNYTPKQIDTIVMQFIKTTNRWLKKYCVLNDLQVVSTYAARHTFASLAKSHLPLAQISAMLGHTKIETTQVYLGRFPDKENRVGLMKVFAPIKKKSA